ncbi:unnamed protein product [Macrosiphum euphorbiae]|uniref:GIY-YIG homing endonuclease n=1 Tax=Macrosiphum euphorbiae TaxID=13131 RepID=A0AAV0XTG1_9HEMI|nr:unnamed protein product [Macrosiphum euphorbiae]
MEDVANISPCKKNPKGKFVGTGQKNIIINVYKDKIKQQLENPEMPKLSFRDLIVSISRTTGIGQRTIQTTLGEYKKERTVSSPNKKSETYGTSKSGRIRQKCHKAKNSQFLEKP